MIQQNTHNKQNRVLSFGVIFLVPLLFIFDVLFYFLTRPACMACGSVTEYMKNMSMSGVIIGELINKIGYLFNHKAYENA